MNLTKLTTIFILGLALAFAGCGDDDNDSSDAGSNETTGEGGAAGEAATSGDGSAEMGPGCYSGPPNHMCDCDIAEADCAAPQIWTDMCPCGDAAGGDTPADQPTPGDAMGGDAQGGEGTACYSPRSHECDCDTNEAACMESGGIWTDMCPCDGESHGDDGHGHDDMDEDHMSSGDGAGCYGGPPTHMCDCETTEEACGESGGIWTDMCEC